MVLDDRTLQYYDAVCATGSIRAAAEQLDLAPSAVSRTVANLERRLDMTLLERTARGVRPTEAGQRLVRFARERAHLESLLVDDLDQLRGLRRGHVRLAAGEGFVDDLMVHALTGFFETYPDVSVELVTGGTDRICELLLSDEADLGLVLHAAPHPDLTVVRQSPQPLHVVCRPEHPFAARGEIDPVELAGQVATVLPAGFGLRTLTDQVQRMYSVSLDIRLVSDSIQALLRFVRAGLGITLLPRFVVGQHVANGHLCALPLNTADRGHVRAQLLVRRGRTPSYAASQVLDHCAANLDSLSAR